MCMLIVKQATATISREMSDDLYSKNSDGFGIMYAENDILHTIKMVGTADQVWELLNQHQHREAVIHYRWNTHGDTDTLNAHPHQVFGDGDPMPLWMAHNGVLSTGNAKDTKLSDTIHYINDYLRPMLQGNPEWVHSKEFLSLIGKHIGSSNKFAFMDNKGRIAVVNKGEFIEKDGLLFSNTYAISAAKFGLYKTYSYGGGGGYTGYGRDWDYEDSNWTRKPVHPQEAAAKKATMPVQKTLPHVPTKAKTGTPPKLSTVPARGKGKGKVKGSGNAKKTGASSKTTFASNVNQNEWVKLNACWSQEVRTAMWDDFDATPMSKDEQQEADDYIEFAAQRSPTVAWALTNARVCHAARATSYGTIVDLMGMWEDEFIDDVAFCTLLANPSRIDTALTFMFELAAKELEEQAVVDGNAAFKSLKEVVNG